MDASARAFIGGVYAYARSTDILCTGPYVKCQLAAYEDTSDVNQSNCIPGEVSIVIMLYQDIIKVTNFKQKCFHK